MTIKRKQPRELREHEIKIRLNEDEIELVESITRLLRKRKGVFMREMAMEHIERTLQQDNPIKKHN